MDDNRHYHVAGTKLTITKHGSGSDCWWTVPCDYSPTDGDKDSIKLDIRQDGRIGSPQFADMDFAEVDRGADFIRYQSEGSPWSFTLAMAVVHALDKHAGANLA